LRELAPLVSVLTPDQKSVNALSKAVSAGAALRGRFEGGQAGVSTGTANGVERRAGNDLASCFLPMALESDSLVSHSGRSSFVGAKLTFPPFTIHQLVGIVAWCVALPSCAAVICTETLSSPTGAPCTARTPVSRGARSPSR
jgi:hypothetical protein